MLGWKKKSVSHDLDWKHFSCFKCKGQRNKIAGIGDGKWSFDHLLITDMSYDSLNTCVCVDEFRIKDLKEAFVGVCSFTFMCSVPFLYTFSIVSLVSVLSDLFVTLGSACVRWTVLMFSIKKMSMAHVFFVCVGLSRICVFVLVLWFCVITRNILYLIFFNVLFLPAEKWRIITEMYLGCVSICLSVRTDFLRKSYGLPMEDRSTFNMQETSWESM